MITGGAVDHGRFVAVPTLIEAQVDRTPDRPALTFGDRTLSYREFDDLANGLAADLAARGVRRGDVLPILLPQGLGFPIACLAVMKLGAAFVPLDPAWPAATLEAAVEVLSARLVVGGESPRPLRERPGVDIGATDLIYGIFTSGSTGTPRCALNVHGGVANRFAFMTRYFAAKGTEVVLQNSRHTVDSTVWQLFWPLTTGARTIVPVRGELLDLAEIAEIIARYRVSLTDFVPSLLGPLVVLAETDTEVRRGLGSLVELIVGGEEIVAPAVHRLRALLPGLRVSNAYGPTEASIGMVFHPVAEGDGDPLPLGTPIDNCYAAVLDEHGRPLGPGEIGEIVIGGACLGAGYLHNPGRTAEVFVPNPFERVPGDRLYRTGDLGRLDAEGRLFFHGRRDFQVKIGGVRIELGEIAAAAERCPGVQQARVLLAPTRPPSLALFVAAPGLDDAALVAHLRRELPADRRPRHRFVLPELPLTVGGKVDRALLKSMLTERLASAADLSADSESDVVLGVFRRVLGDPGLGHDTGFFDAGGDSLAALTVATELRIGVTDLLDHPTATLLAARLGARAADAEQTALMEQDSAIPVGMEISPVRGLGRPDTVLVTGATGFVGSRLVYELLERTGATVYVLCRADDDAHAVTRVAGELRDQGLWRDEFAHRVAGFAGDLGSPGLGLTTRTWRRLAVECEAIVHSGAMVNFLFDYATHRPANVLGTHELLRLALDGRPKALHHVSTLGVLDREASARDTPLAEDFDPAWARRPVSGYCRSKWVAERFLLEARSKGAAVTLYRLGEVMAATDTGYPNSRALTSLLLSACARLGVAPDVALRTDWTPADFAARQIVTGVFAPWAWGRSLHVFHPGGVDLIERSGLAVRRTAVPEFLDRLRADPESRVLSGLLARRALTDFVVDNPGLFRRDEGARLGEE
ncbi:amino acid adenylation domain-containing protein [Nocardia sp. NPDC052566]|uniref:amino acid adenylation domain-containing protein n=1 Tax=Nocardia sp. NPDC052566 TaxID=3364330 RepID=UPI0037C9B631